MTKTIGIIGGIGPESTIDYYRAFLACYHQQVDDTTSPSIVVSSIDNRKMLGLVEAEELSRLTEYLLTEVWRLAAAGAAVGLLAANTPHIVFADVQRQSPIPLVSIVEAACRECQAKKWTQLGLFGTRYTMRGHFYQDIFSRAGIMVVVPEPNDQGYIHEKYITELIMGVFLPDTRAELLRIAERLAMQEGIEGLILGGTELPLILDSSVKPPVPFLNTTQIHVQAVMDYLWPVPQASPASPKPP